MIKFRMFKVSKDEENDETIINGFSQYVLESLRVGDSVGQETDDDLSIKYYKVVSRTFYEDATGALCDIIVEDESN
jgi:hypothetical protein